MSSSVGTSSSSAKKRWPNHGRRRAAGGSAIWTSAIWASATSSSSAKKRWPNHGRRRAAGGVRHLDVRHLLLEFGRPRVSTLLQKAMFSR